jgi:ketopantoate reductase
MARSSDLVLFAVDAVDTLESAVLLQRLLPKGTPVVTLQPGIRRLVWAAQAAPHLQWIRCVMAFDPAQLSQPQSAATGRRKLLLSDTPQTRHWKPRIECAGFDVELCADMQSVQWGHLLLQLNALLMLASGLDYPQMLATRAWRLRYARLLDEALGLLAATGIEPRNLLGVPWRTVPMMLRLNDALFSWLAVRHFSGAAEGLPDLSCADDKSLELAIDATCGEIMRLAIGLGIDAPRTVDLAEQLMVIARQQNADHRQVTSEW